MVASQLPGLVCCWLLLGLLVAAEPELLVADDAEGHRAQIVAALAELPADPAGTILHLSPKAFIAPIGIDVGSGLRRRWTVLLREAIAELPAGAQDAAAAALARRLFLGGRRARGGALVQLLPAAPARLALTHEADLAFDRGDFRRFLALSRLADLGDTARLQVARRELGDLPPVAALWSLGPVAEQSMGRAHPHDGLQVDWWRDGGLAGALDPFAALLWQIALPARVPVLAGPGALVQPDPDGWHAWWDESGRHFVAEEPLPPLRGVRGGRLWCGDTQTGLVSIALNDPADRRDHGPLERSPLGAPLLVGDDGLWWLDRYRIWAVSDGKRSSWLHGLTDVEEGWRLDTLRGVPVLVDATESAFRIRSLQEALDGQTGDVAAALLLRAGAAEAAWEQVSDPALMLDILQRWPELDDGRLGAWWHGEDEVVLRALHARWRQGLDLSSEQEARLLVLARAHAGLALPEGAADLALPAAAWDWQLSGLGLARQLAGDFRPSPVARSLATEAVAIDPARLPRVAVRAGAGRVPVAEGCYWQARLEHGKAVIEARDLDGRWLWRRRLQLPGFLPSLSLSYRDGRLLLLAGQQHLLQLDPWRGELLGRFQLDATLALPSQMAVVAADRLAVLHPLGVGNQLSWLGPEGEVLRQRLPEPASWILPWQGAVLLRSRDGGLQLYQADAEEPGPAPADWPQPLRGEIRPLQVREGLALPPAEQQEGALWPWVPLDAAE